MVMIFAYLPPTTNRRVGCKGLRTEKPILRRPRSFRSRPKVRMHTCVKNCNYLFVSQYTWARRMFTTPHSYITEIPRSSLPLSKRPPPLCPSPKPLHHCSIMQDRLLRHRKIFAVMRLCFYLLSHRHKSTTGCQSAGPYTYPVPRQGPEALGV